MEEKTQKTKVLIKGVNDGYSAKGNGLIDLRIVIDASQIVEVMNLFQMLGKQFKLFAKVENEKTFIGRFDIQNLRVDRDAETKLMLRSSQDDVKIDAAAQLSCVPNDEQIEYLFVCG